MGRYYSGDIEGKFWFGVQDSDDADFFGGQHAEPNVIEYNFSDDDLPSIKDGIKKCREALGKNKEKLDAFFAEGGAGYQGYNDKMVSELLGFKWNDSVHSIRHPEVHAVLEWYARLELGLKILKSVKATGRCDFEAEY